MAGRDITEGRATRAVAVDVGVVSDASIWQNTDIAYDVAIGGMPFIYAISDQNPYVRQTAPFRKEQFDNQTEPGEQSLTGWWIRSQSSFQDGTGITFYDPALIAGEGTYRFADSRGVNVWDAGEVTLLNNTASTHWTTGPIKASGKPYQIARSIKWDNTNGILLHDEFDVNKIAEDGTDTHFIDYISGTDYPVHAICDDGVNAYWVTNVLNVGVPRLRVYSKPLTGTSATTATLMISDNGITVNEATMEYVKDRIIMAVNNKIYEFGSGATALPTPVFTHSDEDIVFTDITASGTAIYLSAFSGVQSMIYKFILNTSGVMPTLTSAITAAEMPTGEKIYAMRYYLGYILIGTSKGIRAGIIDAAGSITYGPIIVETTQPCYDFSFRDRFAWCATGVDGQGGVIRIDLGNDLGGLRFAYANDLWLDNGVTGYNTTTCAFAGETERLVIITAAINRGTITNKQLTSNVATLTTATAHNLTVGDIIWVEGVDTTFNSSTSTYTVTAATTTTFSYAKTAGNVASTAVSSALALVNEVGSINIESTDTKMPTGYLTTGYIRYNTLEPKNFKRLLGRGNFTYGSMTLETVDEAGTEYDIISYDATVPPVEVTTSQPTGSQEYVAYKFILYRDATDATKGPIFKGYQAKATIATPRQRVIRFPVYCFDVETDKYNVLVGYEGRALDRIGQLETVEETGDVVTWQDLTTGESRQCIIEQITFTRMTPPDRGFTGYGGILTMTIRTV